MNLRLGRLFRRMGLPFWTFVGIGLSGVIVTYIGLAGEVLIKDLLWRLGLSAGWVEGLTPFIVLGLVVIIVVGIAVWQNRRLSGRGRFDARPLPQPEGKRGLILLVSRADSAMWAVEYHSRDKGTLEYVWLIPSSDAENEHFGPSSAPVAEEIEERCQALAGSDGWDRELKVQVLGTSSPAEAQDTFDLVNRVYRTWGPRLGLEPREIIADFTGGTKPMSVGMIMACLPAERELQYVAYNQQTRQMSGPYTIDYQHSAFDLIG